MTNMLRVFEREFDLHHARLRLLMAGDGVWFKAGDVAAALGYKKPATPWIGLSTKRTKPAYVL
jgi:prophage antirepressor-like protein